MRICSKSLIWRGNKPNMRWLQQDAWKLSVCRLDPGEHISCYHVGWQTECRRPGVTHTATISLEIIQNSTSTTENQWNRNSVLTVFPTFLQCDITTWPPSGPERKVSHWRVQLCVLQRLVLCQAERRSHSHHHTLISANIRNMHHPQRDWWESLFLLLHEMVQSDKTGLTVSPRAGFINWKQTE